MANLQKIKTLVASVPGMSMESLASQLGITPQALSKLIRHNSTKIETLEAIARILNVPVTVFFDDVSPVHFTYTKLIFIKMAEHSYIIPVYLIISGQKFLLQMLFKPFTVFTSPA